MRVHYLQHVPFEGLGSIEHYLQQHGDEITRTRLDQGESLPSLADLDLLIVMGGPMGVHDTDQYPWLEDEKELIRCAVEGGKRVLGICLGAQLIASAMGARVYRNPDKEIGWFDISRATEMEQHPAKELFPEQMKVFHWHGDTFDIPAVRYAWRRVMPVSIRDLFWSGV